ncbi:apolipoprotein A-IV a [Salarias fasciatus]|uniref:apolipoprotein A-IV a n=1 Tax=Salarias fasciatus TaxID=181472 RepID=UPI001176F06B|nr:apolipoprotein A-IV-like [Salarias fasciatus]
MKVFVFLAIAVFTGCHGNVVQPRQTDMVKDAFWDYVAKMTSATEDSLTQIRQSDLGQEVNTLIASSGDAVARFTDSLRTQVAPLTQDLMTRFTQEADQLKSRLETAVETRLQPYAQQLVADLQAKVDALKTDAAPLVESMDPEALRAVLLQKSQELKEELDRSVAQLQTQMVPYTEEMREKMQQSLDEFQRSLVPMAQSFETQLLQKSQELQQNLSPYGEELKAKLDADAQNLKQQLTALWDSFSRIGQ